MQIRSTQVANIIRVLAGSSGPRHRVDEREATEPGNLVDIVNRVVVGFIGNEALRDLNSAPLPDQSDVYDTWGCEKGKEDKEAFDQLYFLEGYFTEEAIILLGIAQREQDEGRTLKQISHTVEKAAKEMKNDRAS